MYAADGPVDGGSPLRRDVAQFIAEGVERGEAVLVISTRSARAALEAELASLGVRLGEMESRGLALWVDSQQALTRVLGNGVPDESEFERLVKQISAANSSPPGRRIRAYHDLVDVLERMGEHEAAVLVRDMWSDICKRYAELIIAYTEANLYSEQDCRISGVQEAIG